MHDQTLLNRNYLKRELVQKKLAAYFLSLEPGENIESVRALAADLQVSIGMISEIITTLEGFGAVRIDHRGKSGSFMLSQSIDLLWKTAVSGPLIIAHTLPSNRRYEGLAAALKQNFLQAGIETYFSFMRGSRTRLTALRNKACQIAIMSQFAANAMINQTEKVAMTLPEGSFVKAHRLFVRTGLPAGKASHSVAIDSDSYDQAHISYLEFENQSVQFRNVNFMNIHHHLVEKEVDMAIWTEEDMQSQLDDVIEMRTLSPTTQATLAGRNTQAALVVRSDDIATQQLIKKLLDVHEITSLQRSVLSGEMIPEY